MITSTATQHKNNNVVYIEDTEEFKKQVAEDAIWEKEYRKKHPFYERWERFQRNKSRRSKFISKPKRGGE